MNKTRNRSIGQLCTHLVCLDSAKVHGHLDQQPVTVAQHIEAAHFANIQSDWRGHLLLEGAACNVSMSIAAISIAAVVSVRPCVITGHKGTTTTGSIQLKTKKYMNVLPSLLQFGS
jgi:hypothetical protein